MAVKYWKDGNDNWNTPTDWTGNTVPGASDDVTVYQGSPHVTAPISIKSLTVNNPATVNFDNAGANSISTTLTVTGGGTVRLDNSGGEGGTSLSVAGRLTNAGYVQVGNGSLSSTTTLNAASITNTGTIELDGSASKQAQLVIGSVAASTLTGTTRLVGDTLVSYTSGQIRILGAGAYLRLDGANAYVADAGSTTSNSALTGLATISRNAQFVLENGATVSPSNNLANYGSIYLDNGGGDGGSKLNVAGRLTNAGYVQIGNGNLSSTTTLNTGYVTNYGTIELYGSTSQQAQLIVGSVAASTLTGTTRLFGNTLVSYASGQIQTLGGGASLRLDGANAFVADAGSTTSNSALTGLTSVDHNAQFILENGASVAVASYLNNYGSMYLDNGGGDGGSTLSVATRLTNVGYMQIGNGGLSSSDLVSVASFKNTGSLELDAPAAAVIAAAVASNSASPQATSSSPEAVLNVGSAAGLGRVGSLTGQVRVNGNSLIEFTSGQIRTLAANSYLRLNGPDAVIADASDTSSNSALTGLTLVDTGAQLLLSNSSSLNLAGNLTNNGSIVLDYYGGDSGSSLTTHGLDNEGYLQIGGGGQSLGDIITAASLVNNGTINLYGNSPGTNNSSGASLIVNAAAGTGITGNLSGSVYLQGDTLLQFASGEINTISGSLRINGSNAYVADAGSKTSNSALTGLNEVDGSFMLDNSASVTTSGGLTNEGSIDLDYYGGESGASLTVNGTLDNENYLQIGGGGQSLGDIITAASLINTGTINLYGNNPGTTNAVGATLAVGSTAGTGTAGELTGSIYLQGDTLLQFASGQINTIDNGASLHINGSNAYVADAGSTASNSALTGLNEIDGNFMLDNSASVTTSGGLTNQGSAYLDYYGGESGSSLTVNGALDNENYLQIGGGGESLGEIITAASLTNNGAISVRGNGATASATLSVSGSFANNGSITFDNDQQTIGSAVTGFGTTTLQNNATLQFNSTVAASQTVGFNGADKLVLGNLTADKGFAASISNFSTGDSIDLKSFGSSSTFNFAENAAGTAGVLTVTSGANVAHLNFNGAYSNANFAAAASDGMGGTIIAHA